MKKTILSLIAMFIAFNICYAKWHKINIINSLKLNIIDTIPDSLKYIKKADSILSLKPAYVTPNYLKQNVVPYTGATTDLITNYGVSSSYLLTGSSNTNSVKISGDLIPDHFPHDFNGFYTGIGFATDIDVFTKNAIYVYHTVDNKKMLGINSDNSTIFLNNGVESLRVVPGAITLGTHFSLDTASNISATNWSIGSNGYAYLNSVIIHDENHMQFQANDGTHRDLFYAPSAGLGGDLWISNNGLSGARRLLTTNDVIALTTTGNFGAASFTSNVLNIPNYTLAGLGGISGNGTANFLSKFTGTSALGNSLIYDDGTNVGLGTTAPNTKLDVRGLFMTGGQEANLDPSASTGNISYLKNSGRLLVGWNMSASLGETDFIANPGLGTEGGYAFYNMDNSGTLLQTLRIKQTGNIGIGVDNPDAKLAVNGTVHAKEVLVDVNIFPDYVFKPTYHLPTLTEVKTYIDQNHHLPDMPTEAEVVKNGLKLAETENLLTKKVEELTLYLIDLKKENETLKQNQQAITKKLKQHHIN